MEQYERLLLELSKQQDVEIHDRIFRFETLFCVFSIFQKRLLETFKMSAVRDFRFNLDSIPDDHRTLQTSQIENHDQEDDEPAEDDENNE